MGVRNEVESVFSQRADLTDRWLTCSLELGDDHKGNPFEVWAMINFTFFPDSTNLNQDERTREKLPIFGDVLLENLGEVTHLREVDTPSLGLEIANRLVNRDLLVSTIEGESLLVITGEDGEGNLIYGEREVKKMCSLGFDSLVYEREVLSDGEEVTAEHRFFYSWVDVVGD
tara:strand:- start:104 stop:619 length:516 start_codon:yes stop_codon:yes gene_type:complete